MSFIGLIFINITRFNNTLCPPASVHGSGQLSWDISGDPWTGGWRDITKCVKFSDAEVLIIKWIQCLGISCLPCGRVHTRQRMTTHTPTNCWLTRDWLWCCHGPQMEQGSCSRVIASIDHGNCIV